MTCITPRALAVETAALSKPLSCQAIAAASEAGAPCSAASCLTRSAVRMPGVATGEAAGTTRTAGAGAEVCTSAGASWGSLSTVPIDRIAAGSMPLTQARRSTLTEVGAASALSVSPARTT